MKKSNKEIKDTDLNNVSGGAMGRKIDPKLARRKIEPQLAGPKAGGLIKDDELDNVHGGTKSPPQISDAGKDRGIDISPLASKKKKEKNNSIID